MVVNWSGHEVVDKEISALEAKVGRNKAGVPAGRRRGDAYSSRYSQLKSKGGTT
jgi:hypothetical protein